MSRIAVVVSVCAVVASIAAWCTGRPDAHAAERERLQKQAVDEHAPGTDERRPVERPKKTISDDQIPRTVITVRVFMDGACSIDELRFHSPLGKELRFASFDEVVKWLATYNDSELRGGILVLGQSKVYTKEWSLRPLRELAVKRNVNLFHRPPISGPDWHTSVVHAKKPKAKAETGRQKDAGSEEE